MRAALVAAVVLAAGAAAAQPATGSGSGTGTGGTVIQLPRDVEAPEVGASASPSQLVLGGRFTLFVTAAYGDGVEVNLREPMDLGPAFEVVKRFSSDHVRADGKHVRDWQVDLLAWDLGDLEVPPVVVTFTVAGRAGQVVTNAVPVHVSGVLGDVDDPKLLRPDAPPVRLIGRDWTWLWIGGAAAAAVALLAIALWLRRRRRLAKLVGGAPGAPRRIDSASERALARLLAVEESGVLARDDDRKRGYLEMVHVVRAYVGARYHVATAERTAAELVRALERTAPEPARALIAAWLERCELVIYGGLRATADEAAAVLGDARALVMVTADRAREAA